MTFTGNITFEISYGINKRQRFTIALHFMSRNKSYIRTKN